MKENDVRLLLMAHRGAVLDWRKAFDAAYTSAPGISPAKRAELQTALDKAIEYCSDIEDRIIAATQS